MEQPGGGGGPHHSDAPAPGASSFQRETSDFINVDLPDTPKASRVVARRGLSQASLARHQSCWAGLLLLLRSCSTWRAQEVTSQGSERQERAVARQMALLTAEFSHTSPSCWGWLRGLHRINVQASKDEEADFVTRAPPRSQWPAAHFALDLGVSAPWRRPSAGRPPLEDVLEAAAHFARLAMAAYGLLMYQLVKPGPACLACAMCALSNEDAFKRLGGRAAMDVRVGRYYSQPFKPAWWLCVDHVSRTVVVAIRGTWGLSDLFSDVLARQVEFQGHVVHEGILASAKWLLKKVPPELEKCRELDSGGFRLVVTGHSLGGAVGAMLTWMLRQESGNGRRRYAAQCFSFGAPMVVDQHLAEAMQQFVVNVVHHKDWVPRTSRKSLEDLRDRVSALVQTPEQRLARLEAVLRSGNLPTEPLELHAALARRANGTSFAASSRGNDAASLARQVSVTSRDSQAWEDVVDDIAELPSVPMCNPGWQLHIIRRHLNGRCTDMELIMRRGALRGQLLHARTPTWATMQRARPAFTMAFDHFPMTYQYVLEEFAARLQEGQAGTKRHLPEVLARLEAYFDPDGGTDSQP